MTDGLWRKSSGAQSGSKDAGFFSNFISMHNGCRLAHFVLELRRNYLRSCDRFPDYSKLVDTISTISYHTIPYLTMRAIDADWAAEP